MAGINSVKKTSPKVLVALSGGVDSAVSAALLKEQGYAVEGAHMVCWDEGPYCSADADRASAIKVASYLDIPLRVFDFRKEYKEAVVNYFVSAYEAGITPNPDVACNKEIKFGIFFEKALELGYDYIATGHYARIKKSQASSVKHYETSDKDQSLEKFRLLAAVDLSKDQSLEQFRLLAGSDPDKDQSYFLYNLKQKHLSRTLFPIGHLSKVEVRHIAKNIGLPNATKKDSQGICFIGDVEIKEFLSGRVKTKIGNIVNQRGRVIGRHEGIAYYTIGQRESLGISEKIPHYVVAKNPKQNKIVVAPLGEEVHFESNLKVVEVNWVGEKPATGSKIQARIRYRQPLFEAEIAFLNENILVLTCLEPQRAVTPGQSLVIYSDSEQVLGGGVII